MTGPPSPPPDPGRAGRSSGDRVVVGRALVLLAVALVLGIVLIGVAARPPVLAGTSPTTTTTTTAPAAGTTTTVPGSPTTAPPASTTAPRSTSTSRATTTTRRRSGGTTTTTTTVPRSSVKVLVANGTTTPGAAGHYTQVLSGQGWATQAPANASATASSSTVYYAAGQMASASTIATSLGLSSADVQPLTSSVPVSGTSGASIVLVVGPDLAAQASG